VRRSSHLTNNNPTITQIVHSAGKEPSRSQRKSYRPVAQRLPSSVLNSSQQEAWLRQCALKEAQNGSYQTAIDLFTELIEQNPTNAMDYNNRGLVYFQSANYAAAIADYNQALELNPRLDSVYNNRANYYASQGKYLAAILDYEQAIDLNPSNVRAWINQGITFRDLKMYDRALEYFDMALNFERLEGHIYAERGRTYHLRGDWNCAIADYQRAIDILQQRTSGDRTPSAKLQHQINSWLDEFRNSLGS
jgi:tetratricopeptide (TPR) repeat protein